MATWSAFAIPTPTSHRPFPGSRPSRCNKAATPGLLIANRLAGRPSAPFKYRNKGTLATIGRAQAVAEIRGLRLSGRLAWIIWLVVHLGYLVGFENRMLVLLRWSHSFITHGRGTRLITKATDTPPTQNQPTHQDTAPALLHSAR